MTTPVPASSSLLARFKARLAELLGSHYAGTVEMADRVATVFWGGIVVKAISMGVNMGDISRTAWWQAVLGAGVAAVVVFVQSLITERTTGSPALLSFASRTLRARRDFGERSLHEVPVVIPRAAPHKGEHER